MKKKILLKMLEKTKIEITFQKYLLRLLTKKMNKMVKICPIAKTRQTMDKYLKKKMVKMKILPKQMKII